MTMLYPNPCNNKLCCIVTALEQQQNLKRLSAANLMWHFRALNLKNYFLHHRVELFYKA